MAMAETFGPAEGEQDGRVVYNGGSVLVTYGGGSLAVWISFVLDVDDFTMQLDEAESLVAFYRPPDAHLISQQDIEPGHIRRIYTSPTIVALFSGRDTRGRSADRYVEELRFDPSTERARSIEMAIDENP